jgi:hypothetical protein
LQCSKRWNVVTWSLNVVFRSNVVRRSSRCAVIRGRVVLGRFGVPFDRFGGVKNWSIGVVAGNGVVLGSIGVKGWGSIRSRVVLRCLGGVVLRCLGGVVLRCLGGVVLRCLGGVTRGSVIFWGFGVVVQDVISRGVLLWGLSGVVSGC